MTAPAWRQGVPTCICGTAYDVAYDLVTITIAWGRINLPEMAVMTCPNCQIEAMSAATWAKIENVVWAIEDVRDSDGR